MQTRPEGVPAEAQWSESDQEWVLGDRVDGEFEGDVRYWRPNGTLVCICPHVAGKPHGESRRFHDNGELAATAPYERGEIHGEAVWIACDEPTSERTHPAGMSHDIRRIEIDYDRNRPVAFRYYLRDGTRAAGDGSPLPQRPPTVPEDAVRRGTHWVSGVWDAEGKKDGEIRFYADDGALVAVETHEAGLAHGPTTHYRDGLERVRVHYRDGQLHGDFYQNDRDGALARSGRFDDDGWTLSDRLPQGTRAVAYTAPKPVPAPEPPPGLRLRVQEAELHEVPELAVRADPAELAWFIATGWCGDDDRDAGVARVARWAIKLGGPEALREALRTCGLFDAPRVLHPTRLGRLREALAASGVVDMNAFEHFAITSRGVAEALAVANGGAAAVTALRARLSDARRLDLSNMALTELPAELVHLPDIIELDASRNRLTALPPEIADLVFLQTLRLDNNRIAALPPELARQQNLSALHLGHNDLDRVPEGIGGLHELTTLSLGHNAIADIGDELGQLRRLRTLWLNGNPLTDLPPSLGNLTGLRFLHLGEAAWAEPPPVIWQLSSLETLWLSSSALKTLPEHVARLENLKELMIWYSSLTELPRCLFEMTQLRELRVRNNPLPDGTLDRLREALPNCKVY